MAEFIIDGWIITALFILVALSKLLIAKDSYEMKLPLIIASLGVIYFAFSFLFTLYEEFILSHLIFLLICCYYIVLGGKTVALKTITGVFSKITGKPVGVMREGSLNWACPIFERVSANIDGLDNKALDLQALRIEIHDTNLMQTKTRGIQGKIKGISFLLELDKDSILELLEIEGGGETVKEMIIEKVKEFLRHKVTHLTPEELDKDKSDTIANLCIELKNHIHHECRENHYPYFVFGEVIIADTELEQKYYEVLSKAEYAKLEADGKKIDAEKLQERISDAGKNLLPNGSHKEQIEAAMIALGIVKKDISENKLGLDSDLVELVHDIALYFKK